MDNRWGGLSIAFCQTLLWLSSQRADPNELQAVRASLQIIVDWFQLEGRHGQAISTACSAFGRISQRDWPSVVRPAAE